MNFPLPEGIKLGRYEVRSKIGEGGMGEVYLAEDTKLVEMANNWLFRAVISSATPS